MPECSNDRNRNYHINYKDTVFVTMFQPTLISDAAVKRAFTEFGDVHSVFAGTYKDAHFRSICNGKRHVRLTPHGSKQDLPHKIQFHEKGRFFHVMWAEKVIFCKRCAFHHMLKDECSDKQKEAVYTENGVTYDTRPITERMSDGHREAIQSAPQVETALGSPDVATTHKEVPNDTEWKISQPDELAQEVRHENLVQSECHGIPGEIAPIPKDTDSTSWGETHCPGKPGPADVVSAVSANTAETPSGHRGDLCKTSAVGPPSETVFNSQILTTTVEVLAATATVVEAKTQCRKEDLEPP